MHNLFSFLDSGFRILGTLAGLCSELFNDMIPIAPLSFKLHPSLLSPEAFNLDLARGVSSRCRLRHLAKLVAILIELFLRQVLLVLAILNIDGQALGR